jgi:hypothetical protein
VMIGLLPSAPTGLGESATRYQARAASAGETSDYTSVALSSEIGSVDPGETRSTVVNIKNTSQKRWPLADLVLASVFSTGDQNRVSRWANESWETNTRIRPIATEGEVRPGEIAAFSFSLTAPKHPGLYKEYFQPLLNEEKPLSGKLIQLTFEIKGGKPIQSTDAKELRIFRGSQTAVLVEDGFIVAEMPVSTGASGHTTPAGYYTVMNHIPDAYSSEYSLWMPNWMGLTSPQHGFQGYGMHSLPYWRVNAAKYEEGAIYPGGRLYTEGRLYEGFSHLGVPVSHGCIRFGIYESGVVYNWAPNGTPVIVT